MEKTSMKSGQGSTSWTEFSPRGYRRVGYTGLVVGGIEIGYGLAQVLSGEPGFMWFGSAAIVLWSSRVALLKGVQ